MRKSLLALVALFLLIVPTLAGAHGAGHVMGTITAYDQGHVEIKTTDGKAVSVKLGSETKYFRGSAKASPVDLAVGMRAMVHLAADHSAAEVHLPAAPKPASGGAQALTGVVSDAMCGSTHMMKDKTAAECLRLCVKQGAKYALVVGKNVYTLVGHEADLDKYAAQKVRVTGRVNGTNVAVDSVTPMKVGGGA